MKKLLITPPIYIGNNILKDIKNILTFTSYSKIVVITDENLKNVWLPKVKLAIPSETEEIIISPGEKEKNIETVQNIWNQLFHLGCDRKSLIINLGGGVITDMGGFAASTYMRGINFLNIPTTVLSQVDASVGGKTGIDFSGIKNLIGTFNQPIAVIIDTETLTTLPDREFTEGFGEIIKHGLIQDKDYFTLVTSKKPKEYTVMELVEIVEKSCRIKSKIVTGDERENDKRKLLNFGHTIGHAVESAALETPNPLLHGEAVSIGMVTEAKISQLLNYISEEDFLLIKQSLEKIGLPAKINFSDKVIFEKMPADKKSQFGKIKWTLLNQIGEAIIDIDVPEEIVLQAIKYLSN